MKLIFLLLMLIIHTSAYGTIPYKWGEPPSGMEEEWLRDKDEISEALIYSLSKTILIEDSLGIPVISNRSIIVCYDGLFLTESSRERITKSLPDLNIFWGSIKNNTIIIEKHPKKFLKFGLPIYYGVIDLKENMLTIYISVKFAFSDKQIYIVDLRRQIYRYNFSLSCSALEWHLLDFEILPNCDINNL